MCIVETGYNAKIKMIWQFLLKLKVLLACDDYAYSGLNKVADFHQQWSVW